MELVVGIPTMDGFRGQNPRPLAPFFRFPLPLGHIIFLAVKHAFRKPLIESGNYNFLGMMLPILTQDSNLNWLIPKDRRILTPRLNPINGRCYNVYPQDRLTNSVSPLRQDNFLTGIEKVKDLLLMWPRIREGKFISPTNLFRGTLFSFPSRSLKNS